MFASVLAGLLAATAIVVIGLKVRDALHSPHPKSRVVVHDRTTIVQTPVLTPLQARRARRSPAGRSPDSVPPPKGRSIGEIVAVKPQKRPLPSRKPKTVKTKPDRRRPQQRPQQPAQPGQNQPPPPEQPKPPVCVRAPAPVTLSTPVAGVNSC